MSKIIFIISIFIILSPKPTHAFLSPTTLSLVAASIGSIFWGIIISLSVYGVLIYKKAKKYPKISIILTSFIIIIIFLIVNQRIAYLKEINDVYDTVDLMEHEIDLNIISSQELSQYKLFQIKTTVSSILEIKGATQIEKIDLDLIRDFPNILNNIEKFSKEHDITRNNKILFICEGGKSTRLLTILFRNAGYNAHFARLKNIKHDPNNILKLSIKNKTQNNSYLVVVPQEWRSNNKKNIYFTFDLIKQSKFLNSEQINAMQVENYSNFNDRENINQYNIMCSFNLHCVLTKYYLDYLGITQAKIYKIPVSQDKYYDGNLYKLPRYLRSDYLGYEDFIKTIENKMNE